MRGQTVVRSEEFYEGDRNEVYSEAGRGETMQDVLARRWNRRRVLQGGGLAAAAVVLSTKPDTAGAQEATPAATPAGIGTLSFEPIALDMGEDMIVAAGHTVVPL